MKGTWDYVIEVKEAFKETYITDGGLELYANRHFSEREVANRVGKIISLPSKEETDIKEGYEILFDPAILHMPLYETGEQDSPYLLNKEKGWYKIRKELIALYRVNENEPWTAFGDKLMISQIEEHVEEKKSSLIIMPETNKKTFKKGYGIIEYPSSECLENGLHKGDEVFLAPNKYNPEQSTGIEFKVDGKKLLWLKNKDVIGKVIKN